MQRFSILFLFIVLIGVSSCIKKPDVPNTTNTTTQVDHYGGAKLDNAFSIIQTADEGYAMIGHTFSFGDGNHDDIFLVKTDSDAKELWSKNYGGIEDDRGKRIYQTLDGGYFILGNTNSEGEGSSDMFFMKVDMHGNRQWMNTFGDVLFDEGTAIVSIVDDGYFLVGGITDELTAKKDVFVVKTSADGNETWRKQYGGDADEYAFDALDVGDGILILGFNNSKDLVGDIYLVKIDYEGMMMWERIIEDSGYHICNSMAMSSDGGVILSGIYEHEGAEENDVYLMKIDVSGNTIWEKTYGRSGKWNYDEAYDVIESSDQGIVVSGRYKSAMLVIKTDADGNEIWRKTFGNDDAQLTKIAFSVIENSNTEIVICGGQFEGDSGDIILYRLTQDGERIE